MKNNGPVTQKEIAYAESEVFVSTTDLKGITTTANDSFVRISGYSEVELVGKSHNLVRHPDMPAWAFADLWQTLQAGRPWRGIVKNRAKNGDHYWVRANVSPVFHSGVITGYLSLRKKPTRQEILDAEALYRSAPSSGPAKKRSVAAWFSGLRIQNKMQVLLQPVVFILLSTLTTYVYTTVKTDIMNSAYERGGSVGAQLIDTANLFMMTGAINDADNRTALIKKLKEGQHLESAKLMRSAKLVEQFGPGLPEERINDPLVQKIVDSAQATHDTTPYQEIISRNGVPLMRVIAPYALSHDFHGTDCLSCHSGQAGDIVGVSEFYVDLSPQFSNLHKVLMGLLITQAMIQALIFLLTRWIGQRFILRPVNEAKDHIHEIVDGNFSRPVNITGHDEMGEILCAIQSNKIMMGSVIDQIQTAVRNIDQNSAVLSDSVATASRVSQEQSSATHQMAAAIEEISVSIDHVSENSEDARKNAKESASVAAEGGGKVKEVIADMASVGSEVSKAAHSVQALGQRSDEIGSIVRTIREIADQTNLLALNAAIEAARAGELGRGFAVVADEVRKLAEQTSRSTATIEGVVTFIRKGTQEATQMIDLAVERVRHGEKIAEEAGHAITEIESGSEKVESCVSEITSSIREQSIASRDIARSVEQIAAASENNVSAMERVGEASDTLKALSVRLKEFSGKFVI